MPNQQKINDDEWFNIINGKQTAKPNPASQQAQALREALLIEEMISEEHLVKERANILKHLPPKPSRWQRYWQTITDFFKHQPQMMGFIALASLMAVVVVPLMTHQQTGLENDWVVAKSGKSDAVSYTTPHPQQKAQEIKQAFEEQGLTVELKQQTTGWLLSTKLPIDGSLANMTKLLALLDFYNIELPMGSAEIRLLFVKETLERK